MTVTTTEIEVLPKQHEFLTATEREVLYSGAFGAGKSRAVALKCAMRASIPGSREGLCRKHLVTLKATTLKTLLEQDGELPPVLPLGTYSHNKSEKTIKIRGGGEIVYFGLDDEEKIGSYNLSGCGVDEAVELTESDWRQLRGRIRMKNPQVRNQLYGACNPGPPSHHLAERFGLADGHKCRENCRAIQTRSVDNWFLPADYIEDLQTFQGVSKLRYVEGKWVGSEGLVYDRWDRQTFVKARSGPWARIVVGMDEGYTNPAVMLKMCIDSDGRIHIAQEWYKTRQTEPMVIAEAKRWAGDDDIEAFVIDPSAAKLRASMEAEGLPVVEADNAVFAGIQAVQARLVVAGDKRPRVTVDPSCENYIREKETYEWKQDKKGTVKDEPVKSNDHAMDAERYGVMYIDGPRTQFSFRMMGEPDPEGLGEDDEAQDDFWREENWQEV